MYPIETYEHASINLQHELTMGEFILLELYRLGQVDENRLTDLKELFTALDKNHNDTISFEEIQQLDYSSGVAKPSAAYMSCKSLKTATRTSSTTPTGEDQI